MENGHFQLKDSLDLANACLNLRAGAQALGAGDDPLRLDLPPLLNASSGFNLSPEVIRTMAALYFQSELEEAGVIQVSELLAQQRRELNTTSVNAARKLESFAQNARRWYDRQNRALLFARLFGSGAAASAQNAGAINRDFQQRFGTLCLVIMRYGEDYRLSLRPAPTREALLRQVAIDLLVNLASRQFGNTIVAARIIQEQLQQSIDLLNDSDIDSLFQARGMWDALRKILGPEAPDLGRLVTRGQAGLQILNWLASALAQINDPALTQPLLAADSKAFVWAAAWLAATGMDVEKPAQGRVA